MSFSALQSKANADKASYTVELCIEIDIHHDNTSGRTIEQIACDIEDFICENDGIWDAVPSAIGISTSLVDIRHNRNDPLDLP